MIWTAMSAFLQQAASTSAAKVPPAKLTRPWPTKSGPWLGVGENLVTVTAGQNDYAKFERGLELRYWCLMRCHSVCSPREWRTIGIPPLRTGSRAAYRSQPSLEKVMVG